MKKIMILSSSFVFLTSCAFHNGLTSNLNNHTTDVVLSKNNYKVVEAVQGKATATYILGIGGLSKKALIAEARANMLSKANIIGSSKAIANENVEVKFSFFPIVRTVMVVVSGHIIEFTGN